MAGNENHQDEKEKQRKETLGLIIGKNLKKIREDLKLSQKELAARLNVAKLTIHFYEKGKTIPDAFFISKLTDECGLTANDVLAENGDEDIVPPDPVTYTIGLLQSINKAGITGVFDDRRVALEKFMPRLRAEDQEVAIVGSSFLGIRNAGDDLILLLESKMKTGAFQLRALFTHPDFSSGREKQESRREGSIRSEIKESADWLRDRLGVEEGNIRFYKGTPTVFLIATRNSMLLNPYPYGTEAFKSFCLEVAKTSSKTCIYNQYYQYHYQGPWDSTNSATFDEAWPASLTRSVSPDGRA